jgi:hypothetical protein
MRERRASYREGRITWLFINACIYDLVNGGQTNDGSDTSKEPQTKYTEENKLLSLGYLELLEQNKRNKYEHEIGHDVDAGICKCNRRLVQTVSCN